MEQLHLSMSSSPTSPLNQPTAKQVRKRPVGRPRADGRPQLTRQAVMRAAAKLIAENGYAGTSIRMIATAVDAVPASVFNLFVSKDALLNELIDVAATPSLTFYRALTKADVAPGVALYKSVFEEARTVASANREYSTLFYLPELAKPQFRQAQQVRADMVSHYHRLIKIGVREGELVAQVPAHTAEQVFQLTETSILAGAKTSAIVPEEQARLTARLCLRALLSDQTRLDQIADAAAKIDLSIVLPGNAIA